jgi:hypothetical protein
MAAGDCPQGAPQVTPPHRAGTSFPGLSFPSLKYTIQAKADLNFGVNPREADPVTATGLTHTLRIELDKTNPKDFIRIRRNLHAWRDTLRRVPLQTGEGGAEPATSFSLTSQP